MDISIRSCLTAGVAAITAAAIAFVPSVAETPPAAAPPAPVQVLASDAPIIRVSALPIKPTAQVQPVVTATDLPSLLVEWLQRIIVPPSAGQPFPTPQFPPVVAPTSIGSTIKSVYNAVEPWVRWGFDLAAYAVGWVPYVGWLAPQITIFYNFGERIAHSITFNVADWLDGKISFVQGLVNVGIDTINSFIFLANDQLRFWLPPLPPIHLPFAASQATTEPTVAAATDGVTTAAATLTETTQANEKHIAVKDQELAAAPNEEAAVPDELAAAPNKEAAVPDELAAAPNEKAAVPDELATDATDEEATDATDEVAVNGQKESAVDTAKDEIQAAKEPKTTPSSSTGVSARGEVRGAPNEPTTAAAKVSNGDKKKGDEGPTTKGATESSTDSSATSNDTGAKHDIKGGKKDGTGKKTK